MFQCFSKHQCTIDCLIRPLGFAPSGSWAACTADAIAGSPKSAAVPAEVWRSDRRESFRSEGESDIVMANLTKRARGKTNCQFPEPELHLKTVLILLNAQ